MSGIFGILGIDDTDRKFVSTLGQSVVYDAIQELLTRYNTDLNAALAVFVEGTTEDYKLRYKLPGGGRLQRLGKQAPPAEVRAIGQWDVAYPLEGFGAAVGGGRIDMAYMTVQDLDKHLDTVMIHNTQDTFEDDLHGALLIEPFANGDSVNYPPVLGSESEATEDHYLSTSGAPPIADANNPFPTMVDELEEHFGAPTGGSNIVVFHGSGSTTAIEGLAAFNEVPDRFVELGDDTAKAIGLPANLPGRIVGRVNGAWSVEWRWIPANYLLGIHMDAPKPIGMRVDPADTGLQRGLAMIARDDEYPIETSYWEHRLGFGATNRLNGVFMFVDAGGFAVPSGF